MQAQTKSRVDLAKEAELYSQIEENQASSAHKTAQAEFDLVKSMVELESLDLETIAKALEIAQNIKMGNNPEQKQSARRTQ